MKREDLETGFGEGQGRTREETKSLGRFFWGVVAFVVAWWAIARYA